MKGRGTSHQIDAIADFLVAQPFSYPSRLLVEAKCYSPGCRVGLDRIRAAVGRLKDVREYWSGGSPEAPNKQRYAYKFAYFSASGYTEKAQAYAFAQDIYTIPVGESEFLQRIVRAIRGVKAASFGVTARDDTEVDFTELRMNFRQAVLSGTSSWGADVPQEARRALGRLVEILRRKEGAILAMLANRFPIFLVPAEEVSLEEFTNGVQTVRIYYAGRTYYLCDERDRRRFSFELPEHLFQMYADRGILSQRAALDLKADTMREIQGFLSIDDEIRLVRFRLDCHWLETWRQQRRG